MRQFQRFSYKDTNVRVSSPYFNEVVAEIVEQRKLLEKYILRHPAFQHSLKPVELYSDAPMVAVKMATAAIQTGLGPMAAVAGTLAQYGVERAKQLGATETIIENGGDMYLISTKEVIVGIHSQDEKFGDSLAFLVDSFPISICSSSSQMGHSISMGNCGLATAVSKNASLADCAATLLCNSIQRIEDMSSALEKVGGIDGIDGVMAMLDGRLGMQGVLPQIVRNDDAATPSKVTRDRRSY